MCPSTRAQTNVAATTPRRWAIMFSTFFDLRSSCHEHVAMLVAHPRKVKNAVQQDLLVHEPPELVGDVFRMAKWCPKS